MTVQPIPAIVTAGRATMAQGAIGISVMALSLIFQLWGLYEKYPKMRPRRDGGDRAILALVGLSLFSLAFYIVEVLMYASNWIGQTSSCNALGSLITFFYLTSKQFLYYFLYERAAIVLDALGMTKGVFRFYRYIILLVIIFGVP